MYKNVNFVFIVILFFGCFGAGSDYSSFIGEKICLNDSLISNENYTVLYRIDTQCSICVGKFMEFNSAVNNSKLHSRGVKCIYYAKTNNTQLFDYHIEKFKIEFGSDKLVYIKLQDIFKQNPFMNNFKDPNNFIILLDNQKKIVDIGNPFKDERSRRVYKQLKLL